PRRQRRLGRPDRAGAQGWHPVRPARQPPPGQPRRGAVRGRRPVRPVRCGQQRLGGPPRAGGHGRPAVQAGRRGSRGRLCRLATGGSHAVGRTDTKASPLEPTLKVAVPTPLPLTGKPYRPPPVLSRAAFATYTDRAVASTGASSF